MFQLDVFSKHTSFCDEEARRNTPSNYLAQEQCLQLVFERTHDQHELDTK